MRPRRPLASLEARALQWLAQREHSRVELRRKLLAHAQRLAGLEAPEAVGADAQCGAAVGADAATGADGADFASDQGREPAREQEHAATRSRRAPPSRKTQADVDALLDALAARGALSDARFVETRVRARAARQGKLRIVQELAQHGLALSADDAQALAASEFARAKAVWARKFGAPATDAAGRARQMRFLAARGFSAEVVRRVLRGAGDDD